MAYTRTGRPRGRPKGSRNKPKATTTASILDTMPETPEQQNTQFEEEQRIRSARYLDELDALVWTAENTNLIPLLWGPTSTGKTYEVRKLAERRKAWFAVVLTGSETPDEILGFRVYHHDRLVHGFPEWFSAAEEYLTENPDGEAILFFDELGHAPTEVRGTLMTWFRDGHIRGRRLPGKSMVIAATNPTEMSGAWRARFLPIHFPNRHEALIEIAKGHELAEWVVGKGRNLVGVESSDPELDNSPPRAPANLNKANVGGFLRRINHSFYRLTPEAQSILVSAMLPETLAEQTLRRLNEEVQLNVDLLAREPALTTQALMKLPKPRAVQLAVSVLATTPVLDDDEQRAKMLGGILDAFMEDVDKLHDYYETSKPSKLLEEVSGISPQAIEAEFVGPHRVEVVGKNNELSGKWVDALMRQVKEQRAQG